MGNRRATSAEKALTALLILLTTAQRFPASRPRRKGKCLSAGCLAGSTRSALSGEYVARDAGALLNQHLLPVFTCGQRLEGDARKGCLVKKVRQRGMVSSAAFSSKVWRPQSHLEESLMAVPENIKEFNKNAAKVFEALIKAHPKKTHVYFTELTGEDKSILDDLLPEELYTQERESAHACMAWLLEEEYVRGEYWQFGLSSAGLPRASWEALKMPSVLRPKNSVIDMFIDAVKGISRVSRDEAIGEVMSVIFQTLK
jgi:hypothetical protein